MLLLLANVGFAGGREQLLVTDTDILQLPIDYVLAEKPPIAVPIGGVFREGPPSGFQTTTGRLR